MLLEARRPAGRRNVDMGRLTAERDRGFRKHRGMARERRECHDRPRSHSLKPCSARCSSLTDTLLAPHSSGTSSVPRISKRWARPFCVAEDWRRATGRTPSGSRWSTRRSCARSSTVGTPSARSPSGRSRRRPNGPAGRCRCAGAPPRHRPTAARPHGPGRHDRPCIRRARQAALPGRAHQRLRARRAAPSRGGAARLPGERGSAPPPGARRPHGDRRWIP